MLIKTVILILIMLAPAVSAPLVIKEGKIMFQHAKNAPWGEFLTGENSMIEWYFENCCTDNEHTLRNKYRDIRLLLEFLTQTFKCMPHEIEIEWITRTRLERFVSWRMKEGDSPDSVNRRIAAFKHLFNSAYRHYPAMPNPAEWVRFLKLQRSGFKALPAEKFETAIQAAYSTGKAPFLRYRSGFFFELLIHTGLRPHDLSNICLEQLSEDRNWILGDECKGRKFRNVYLPDVLKPRIDAWLHHRDNALRTTQGGYDRLTDAEKGKLPLLITVHQARLSKPESLKLKRENMSRIVEEIQDRCGFKVNARMCRHAFAHWLLDKTKDIRLVCQALGHSDVRTTMRYLELSDDQIGKRIEDANPAARAA